MAALDHIGVFGPDKRFGVGVVALQILRDGVDQLGHALERAATNSLLRDLPEPSLDHVQPRTAGGNEVQVEARVLGQEPLHHRALVRRVVVHDQMQVQVGRRLLIDLLEELHKLLGPMTWHALADYLSVQHVQGGEQRRCPVPLVVVRLPRRNPRPQRQQRLGPVQRLNLAFLVHRQHQRMIRRVEVQPHHVPQLFHEMLVVGELESLQQVRLQPVLFPNPLHRHARQPLCLGHGPNAPVGFARRRRPHRRFHHPLDHIRADALAASGTRGVLEDSRHATRGETLPPEQHRRPRNTQFPGDGVIGLTLAGAEHDAGSQRDLLRRLARIGQVLQPFSLIVIHVKGFGGSEHPTSIPTLPVL